MVSIGERVTHTAATAGRSLTAFRRQHSRVRHALPPGLTQEWVLWRSRATGLRRYYLPVEHRSPVANLFHCGVQKTGSQWIVSMLSDPVVYRHTGLEHFQPLRQLPSPDTRPLPERRIERAFPPGAIVSPLYVTYPNFAAMPKAGTYRAFFVSRDPRELLVSWYFSARANHLVRKGTELPLQKARRDLQELSVRDGLRYAIDYWEERGRFDALRSWADAEGADEAVRIIRYEDLVGAESAAAFRSLFDFLAIPIPEDSFAQLLEAYSFRRLSGHAQGTEDTRSHLRAGTARTWSEHFDEPLLQEFTERTGDLATRLGYDR